MINREKAGEGHWIPADEWIRQKQEAQDARVFRSTYHSSTPLQSIQTPGSRGAESSRKITEEKGALPSHVKYEPGTFGALVREFRMDRAFTQRKTAEVVGISERTLSKVELFNSKVAGETALKLGDFLGFTFENPNGIVQYSAVKVAEIPENFSELLRNWRIGHGKTQEQIGLEMGWISNPAKIISRLETGKSKPAARTLRRLRVLGFSSNNV